MKDIDKIRIAIVGIGNCASSLIQGISYYAAQGVERSGVMHWDIGGYKPSDMEPVAAFDVDPRKVGKNLNQAVLAKPNNTKIFCEQLIDTKVIVAMGKILDGVAEHFVDYDADEVILASAQAESTQADVVRILRNSGAEVLINYLPVGAEQATKFYMECALEAGVAVINCMPCFIASDQEWQARFKAKGLPIIGDDIKAQIGATIIHRALVSLFENRGVTLDRTYQLNVGGNTDFLNMLDNSRLATKKISKTAAVKSILHNANISTKDIHIGPSGYVPWLQDNKVCFLRMEGKTFGNVPMNIEIRLSVEDSPNSAGVVVDAIRCCKLAIETNQSGAIESVSSYLMKHPPKQYTDEVAHKLLEDFITRCTIELQECYV